MTLPADFIERTKLTLGEEFSPLEKSLFEDSPTSVRINRFKTDKQLSQQPVLWCRDGYYLEERAHFTFDPLFHAGLYYVQEASSMFVEQIIRQHTENPSCVLDLCAAPGGKSTHLRTLLPEDCLLVSNEVIRNRAHILSENLIKWGSASIAVTNNKPGDLGRLTHLFDVILVDAPCSGEGMFRKDPDSVLEWSVENVLHCATRQRDIIDDVWDALKPGGVFVYSTCTYNTEENEENVSYITNRYGAEVLDVNIDDEWNISESVTDSGLGYRFFPHKLKGEGFFICALRKPDDEPIRTPKKDRRKERNDKSAVDEQIRRKLQHPSNFIFTTDKGFIYALRKSFESHYQLLSAECNLIHKGILMGEMKGKDFVPNHNLALSVELNKCEFQTAEVDYKTAIAFLRTEALCLDESLQKGFTLITYKHHPLGWVKNLGSRANNLYPHEWRIRSTALPEIIKTIWEE